MSTHTQETVDRCEPGSCTITTIVAFLRKLSFTLFVHDLVANRVESEAILFTFNFYIPAIPLRKAMFLELSALLLMNSTCFSYLNTIIISITRK